MVVKALPSPRYCGTAAVRPSFTARENQTKIVNEIKVCYFLIFVVVSFFMSVFTSLSRRKPWDEKRERDRDGNTARQAVDNRNSSFLSSYSHITITLTIPVNFRWDVTLLKAEKFGIHLGLLSSCRLCSRLSQLCEPVKLWKIEKRQQLFLPILGLYPGPGWLNGPK